MRFQCLQMFRATFSCLAGPRRPGRPHLGRPTKRGGEVCCGRRPRSDAWQVYRRLWDGAARRPKEGTRSPVGVEASRRRSGKHSSRQDWVAAWQAMGIPADRQGEAGAIIRSVLGFSRKSDPRLCHVPSVCNRFSCCHHFYRLSVYLCQICLTQGLHKTNGEENIYTCWQRLCHHAGSFLCDVTATDELWKIGN